MRKVLDDLEEIFSRTFLWPKFCFVKPTLTIRSIDALPTNNTGFGLGFLHSDWQNSSQDQSNLEPYIDWLSGRKIRTVGISFA